MTGVGGKEGSSKQRGAVTRQREGAQPTIVTLRRRQAGANTERPCLKDGRSTKTEFWPSRSASADSGFPSLRGWATSRAVWA